MGVQPSPSSPKRWIQNVRSRCGEPLILVERFRGRNGQVPE
jgi:hypothetical protein